MHKPVLSRNGSMSGLGKCTAEIKILVPEELKDVLLTFSVIDGQSLSEHVRDLLTVHAYGRLHAIRLQGRTPNGTPRTGSE